MKINRLTPTKRPRNFKLMKINPKSQKIKTMKNNNKYSYINNNKNNNSNNNIK
jgi:hypothetical protein